MPNYPDRVPVIIVGIRAGRCRGGTHSYGAQRTLRKDRADHGAIRLKHLRPSHSPEHERKGGTATTIFFSLNDGVTLL